MAAANTALRISELDFASIRNNLKTFLQSQNEFTDYDFEGSGLSVLLDVLAYNTHYMGYYLNMVGNEMFLDTAQLRGSILSHAKQISYVPTSAKGSEAVVNIVITPDAGNTVSTLSLEKDTTFISERKDGVHYVFAVTDTQDAVKSNGKFTFSNVGLRQGEPLTQRYIVTEGTRRFTIPTANADLDTLTVKVQESSSNTDLTVYTKSTDITQVNSNSTVYFIEENTDDTGTYILTFGDGVIGKKLSNNNILLISYLDTNGDKSNKVNAFTSLTTVGGFSNIAILPVSAAAGGAPKETIESIRYRAPYYYTTQNRAVTLSDYETLLLKDYPNIDAISVWSGADNEPVVYGKVFISMKPKENYFITIAEKDRIINDIVTNRSILTVTPEIIDPDYTYILVNATVNYDPAKTTLDEGQLKTLIRQSIIDYRNDYLRKFSSTFRQSKLQQYIDDAHPSILGSSVQIYAQKRKEITTGQSKNYTINFNIPLFKGTVENKIYVYPDFTITDSEGTSRERVYIEDTPLSLTGIDSIAITNAGSGYQTAPTVTITGDGTGATAVAKITNGKVTSVEVVDRGSDYTAATVSFSSDSGTGASASARIQLRTGILRTFYYKSNGEKVFINENAGTIDYDTGIITILGFEPSSIRTNDRYDTNFLTFNAVPLQNLITPIRNRILDIDDTDSGSIVINLVAEG